MPESPSPFTIHDSRLTIPIRVAIALGSNLGDREQHLRDAIAALNPAVTDIRLSRFHETDPVDMPGNPPRVINAALTGTTALDAHTLLRRLLAIERDLGRQRPYPGASRTIDLDVILYGDAVINDPPELIVPHPRFRERAFVLEPLADVASDWIDPVTGKTIAELLAALRG